MAIKKKPAPAQPASDWMKKTLTHIEIAKAAADALNKHPNPVAAIEAAFFTSECVRTYARIIHRLGTLKLSEAAASFQPELRELHEAARLLCESAGPEKQE